jgi:hypothetical protein
MAADRARLQAMARTQATDCSPITVNGDMNVTTMNVYVAQRLPVEAFNVFAEAERDAASHAASAAAGSAVMSRTAARAAAVSAKSVADNAHAIFSASQAASVAANAVVSNAERIIAKADHPTAALLAASSLPPMGSCSVDNIAKKAVPVPRSPFTPCTGVVPRTPVAVPPQRFPVQPTIPPPKKRARSGHSDDGE